MGKSTGFTVVVFQQQLGLQDAELGMSHMREREVDDRNHIDPFIDTIIGSDEPSQSTHYNNPTEKHSAWKTAIKVFTQPQC